MRQPPHKLVLEIREEKLHWLVLPIDKAEGMREGLIISMTIPSNKRHFSPKWLRCGHLGRLPGDNK
jgi:hypothetical protein